MSLQPDLRFTFQPASGLAVQVVEFRLEESLSSPFKLRVDLSSENPALLTIWHGEQGMRYVHGIISGVEQGATGFRRTRYASRPLWSTRCITASSICFGFLH